MLIKSIDVEMVPNDKVVVTTNNSDLLDCRYQDLTPYNNYSTEEVVGVKFNLDSGVKIIGMTKEVQDSIGFSIHHYSDLMGKLADAEYNKSVIETDLRNQQKKYNNLLNMGFFSRLKFVFTV